PVLHGRAGQGDVGLRRDQAAAGRCPIAVAGVVVPAQGAGPRVDGLVADLVLVVDEHLRAEARDQVHLVAADAQADTHPVVFRDRNAEIAGERLRAGTVVGEIGVAVIGFRITGRVTDADAVVGQVRVVVVDPEAGLVFYA